MKKSDIENGLELIEKKASDHTDKLQIIVILGIHTGYSFSKNRSYTYYTEKTKEGTFYPAKNAGRNHAILDGIVGTRTLLELKRDYIIHKS